LSRRAGLGYAVSALICAALFAALGSWQLQRGRDKEARLAEQNAALMHAHVALADVLEEDADATPIQRVRGHGRFLQPLLLLDHQQRQGRVGIRAYGVAAVEGGESHVLVDLGWLPLPPDRTLPQPAAPNGLRTLDGLRVPWPGQGLRLRPNAWSDAVSGPRLLTYLDRHEIEAAFGLSLASGVLRLDPGTGYGHERDLQLLPNTLPPERHYGYALQWFALSTTVIVVYVVLTWRRLRRTSK
jgi:cytochrome oxidase assembly protein ShyY1